MKLRETNRHLGIPAHVSVVMGRGRELSASANFLPQSVSRYHFSHPWGVCNNEFSINEYQSQNDLCTQMGLNVKVTYILLGLCYKYIIYYP